MARVARTTGRRVARLARAAAAVGLLAGSAASVGVVAETLAAAPAGATGSCGGSLGTAGAFNEFSIGNATRSNSDVGGRAAYGGNVSINSFSFGTQLATVDPTRLDLIVGGNLAVGGGGGQVMKGSATYGGALSGPGVLGHPNGTLTNAAPPFSFSTEGSNLVAESSAIAGLAPVGTVVTSGAGFVTMTLLGNDPTQNVFNLTAAQLSGVNELDVNVPFTASSASTTIVNVTGNYDVGTRPLNVIKIWNGSSFEQDSGSPTAAFSHVRARLLFNFSTASAVTIATNMAFEGTVLAPLATVTVGQGQTNAGVIGAVINGTGESHNFLFDSDGCLPPTNPPVTPEVPYALVLPIGAIAVGGLFVARRRHLVNRATA
jgi:choice-of-anchor A domain-containing protein